MTDSSSWTRALARHGRLVFACVALAGAAAVFVDSLTPPLYEATLRLEIQRPAARTPWTDQALAVGSAQAENLTLFTSTELIKRRTLLVRLAEDMAHDGLWIARARVHRAPWSVPWKPASGPGVQQAAVVPDAAGERQPAASRIDADASVLELSTMISVRPVQGTRLVDVAVRNPDPRLAIAIADRLAALFVADQRDRNCDADTSGLATLEQQLRDTRARIRAASTDAEPGGPTAELLRGRATRIGAALAQMDGAWTQSEADRQDVSARLARLDRYSAGGGEWGSTGSGSEALDALHRDLEACARRLAAARAVYKPLHPRLAAIDSEYAALQSLERERIPLVRRELGAQVTLDKAHAARLKSAMADSERVLATILARAAALDERNGGLDADRQLEGRLLTRIRDRLIEAPLDRPPVQVVDAAAVDPAPVRPRRVLDLAVALAAGLLLGVGLALVRHANRRKLEDPGEMEERLNLPVVAVIPDTAQEGRP